MTNWHEELLLIDGKLVPATGGATYDTVNPATEAVLGVAADASVDDARQAIEAARRAFDTTDWSRDHALRVRCLRQLEAALRAEVESLREILVQEVGAPIGSTAGPQLEAPIDIVGWYADLVERFAWTEDLGERDTFAGRHHRWIEREAAGVVAAITAYNYPIQLALAKLAPALAAGCTVVLKGAPDTPWATLALGKLIADSTDIPPGVVNVITSSDNAVGIELTTNPDVDVISFTGSTPVGRAIMAAASDTVKRVFLELGGKSAFVLLDDGDPNMAGLFCAYAATSHSGQGCAITSRLVVPRARFDDVVDVARATLEGVPYGDPTDPGTMMGPLISAKQREKVAGYVDRAVADGAKAVIGGRTPSHLPKGYFYEPTLLVGAGEDSAVAQDELFGPVLVVLPHDGDDDAVRVANNSIFGLSGSVLSGDRERALGVARRIRAGTMSVNGGIYYGPDAPFGGYKQSGMGREMGEAGLHEFLEVKTLAEPAGPARAHSRVVQWATGNIGTRALREVIRHPGLELAGVLVYDPAKDGTDAGVLCGLDPVGVTATTDRSAITALDADCVLHMPRVFELDDVIALLERGTNVVSTRGELMGGARRLGDDGRARVIDACTRGNASAYATGSSPGFISDALPYALLSLQRRVDLVEINEYANLSQRDSPHLLFQQMGFGQPPETFSPARAAYLLEEFRPALEELTNAAGRPADEWTAVGEVAVAREDTTLLAGELPAGTVGAQRTTIAGRRGGADVVRFTANWFCTPNVDPAWDLHPTGWRVRVEGDAPMAVELPFPVPLEELKDFTPGYTANRPVNAIPYVCEAPAGILSTMDLPPITPAGARAVSEPVFRVLPALDELNTFFWTSGADGRLRFLACSECSYLVHPPAPFCPQCECRVLAPTEVSGRATLHSFTVNHQPWDGVGDQYVIGLVEIDEQPGVRLTTNIVDIDPEAVQIGMKVEVTFEDHAPVFVPLFRPAPA